MNEPENALSDARAALARLARAQPFDRRLLLAGLVVGVATALTLGSGWGQACALLGSTIPASGAFALAGLCGVFTAAFSAPITGMMLGVEMTRDYGLVVPIMVCCAMSYIGSRRVAA